jgi:hypothetical protein
VGGELELYRERQILDGKMRVVVVCIAPEDESLLDRDALNRTLGAAWRAGATVALRHRLEKVAADCGLELIWLDRVKAGNVLGRELTVSFRRISRL